MDNAIIFTFNDLKEVSSKLAQKLIDCKIITLSGPLGVGKTTLIREILRNYGVKQEIVSPTFNYLNIYKNEEGKRFFHFDLYRIKSLDEFLMAGFDEYLHENGQCFIEWPEIIEALLSDKQQKTCKISIDYVNENDRILIV